MAKIAASASIQPRGKSRARASLLAPDGDGFRAGARRRRELREAAQPSPRLRGIGLVQPRVLERQAILDHPVLAPQRRAAAPQAGRDVAQVQDIVGRVFQLCGR